MEINNQNTNNSTGQTKNKILDFIFNKNKTNEISDKTIENTAFLACGITENIFDITQMDDKTLMLKNDFNNWDNTEDINLLNEVLINKNDYKPSDSDTQENIVTYQDSGNIDYERTYTYDQWGRLKEETYTSYNEDGTKKTTNQKLYNDDKVIFSSEYKYKENNQIEHATRFEADKNGNAIYEDSIYFDEEGSIQSKARTYYNDNTKTEKDIVQYDSQGNKIESNTQYDKKTGKIKTESETIYDKENKITSKKQEDVSLNKNIEGTKQGQIGDCWLLSGVNALSYTEKGREIIDNALTYTPNGVIVSLADSTVTYSITNEELLERKEGKVRSEGDDDMIVLEMAIERFRKDIAEGNLVYSDNFIKNESISPWIDARNTGSLKGGSCAEALSIITGNFSQVCDTSKIDELLDSKGTLKNKNVAITMGKHGDSSTVKDVNGEEVYLPTNHAYALKSIENNVVTITNPWNSNKEITLDKKTFVQEFDSIGVLDLSQKSNEPLVIETTSQTKIDLNGNIKKIVKDKDGNKLKEIKYDKKGEVKEKTRYTQDGEKSYKKFKFLGEEGMKKY